MLCVSQKNTLQLTQKIVAGFEHSSQGGITSDLNSSIGAGVSTFLMDFDNWLRRRFLGRFFGLSDSNFFRHFGHDWSDFNHPTKQFRQKSWPQGRVRKSSSNSRQISHFMSSESSWLEGMFSGSSVLVTSIFRFALASPSIARFIEIDETSRNDKSFKQRNNSFFLGFFFFKQKACMSA